MAIGKQCALGRAKVLFNWMMGAHDGRSGAAQGGCLLLMERQLRLPLFYHVGFVALIRACVRPVEWRHEQTPPDHQHLSGKEGQLSKWDQSFLTSNANGCFGRTGTGCPTTNFRSWPKPAPHLYSIFLPPYHPKIANIHLATWADRHITMGHGLPVMR